MKRLVQDRFNWRKAGGLVLGLLVQQCQGGSGPGMGDPPPPEPSPPRLVSPEQIYASRPNNTTCKAYERPQVGQNELSLQQMFANLTLQQPIFAVEVPSKGNQAGFWLVAERDGRLLQIDSVNGTDQVKTVIDLTNVVDTSGEGGLLGFALHPNFLTNRILFLSYTTTNPGGNGGPLLSKLTRFTLPTANGITETAGQILITLTQPYNNHNGGYVQFGLDGYLYWGLGDGGSGNDPLGAGQDLSTLLGKLLRIDVNQSGTAQRPYGIPSDNPFVSNSNARPEIFASGLRNPWRWSVDRVLGDIWIADVGQDTAEEITITPKGANLGWSTCEGPFQRGSSNQPCTLAGATAPISWYLHQGSAKSITGGYVYRGGQIPNLQGRYLYSDYTDPTIYALPAGLRTGENNRGQALLQAPGIVVSFAEDAQGELVVFSWGNNTGRIDRIIKNPTPNNPPSLGPPLLLSATGCLDLSQPNQFVPGVIPYEPRSTLWSDRAVKHRGLALPDDTRLELGQDGHLALPIGGVLLKTFLRDDARLETRLLARHGDGTYSGITYKWREDGQEGDLVQTEVDRLIAGGQWLIPTRSECMLCHTAASGFTLGLSLSQLAGPTAYRQDFIANQLEVLEHLDMLPAGALQIASPQRAEIHESQQPLWLRSRSYLDTNCSNCHRPGSSGRGDLDLRLHIPLADTGLCRPPQLGDFQIANAMLLAPGAPQSSVMLHRMELIDSGRMPPLGSREPHQEALAVLEDWIRGLTSCANGTR